MHAFKTEGLVAHALSRLSDLEGRPIQAMFDELGLSGDPTILLMCRVPRTDEFWADAQQIASLAGIAPDALVRLLRRSEVLDAFSSPPVSQAQDRTLLAARDYDQEPEEGKSNE
jgi:hypothetical protein